MKIGQGIAIAMACVIALPTSIHAKGGGRSGGGHSSGGHSGGSHSTGGHSGKSGTSSAGGSHAVRAHVTKKGTYVAPTRATNPNRTQRDNYSSKPNVNPSNGKQGTRTPTR